MSGQKYQALRGMQDLIGNTCLEYRTIESTAFDLAARYGYQEIRTPILEASGVFHRTLGETSDVVTKETYTFTDRGGDDVTLRTEGTAPAVRALVSNGLTHELPLKLYYYGPMFRYERPQKGRLRQFHQIGVEAIGYPDAWSDVETIALGYQLLTALGLKDRIQLELNTLGDSDSRNRHRQAFVSYLEKFKNDLSTDSQVRLERNPLRILDSKDSKDNEILLGAPTLNQYLNPESQKFFDAVLTGLSDLGITPVVTPRLVRGFDYYSHTVFEFTTQDLGAQSAVLAGGRYNGLVELMGGPEAPSIGWAAGVERLHLLTQKNLINSLTKKIMVLPMSENEWAFALKTCQELRSTPHLVVDMLTSSKLPKRLQKADKKGFDFVAIIGSDEAAKGFVTLKNLKTGEQVQLPPAKISSHLQLD